MGRWVLVGDLSICGCWKAALPAAICSPGVWCEAAGLVGGREGVPHPQPQPVAQACWHVSLPAAVGTAFVSVCHVC